MVNKLQFELKQSKPFVSLGEETFLNIARTTEYLFKALDLLLKQFDVTATQYNVLRILRGAGELGLASGEVGNRMLTSVPDTTRLLGRLEARGLISRHRPKENRRIVIATITSDGLELLSQLDQPIFDYHQRMFGQVSEKNLVQLINTLEDIRKLE